jgi:predicted secreted protein
MKSALKLLPCATLLLGGAGAPAQTLPTVELRNIVSLSAAGTVEAEQDLLTLTLSTVREGSEAAAVQALVRQALDATLADARKAALPGAMDVRTGGFSLQPRYNRDGKISAWVGSAELVLEGRDFSRIGTFAGKVQAMSVSNVYFSLSREARARVEGEAQASAIERFKGKATDVARNFGFAGYTLREVNVVSDEQGGIPRPRLMAMAARASGADAAPLPVEAGKTAVVITVNGSVQLR